MADQNNGNLHEFILRDEIFNTILALLGFGALFGFLANVVTVVLMRQKGDLGLWLVIGLIAFGIFGVVYAFKLRKFDKEFGIRPDNKYSIDKIKNYYGAPVNINEDKDNYYYTFREEMFGMFAKTHVFTTDKSGTVKKHEVSSIEKNKH